MLAVFKAPSQDERRPICRWQVRSTLSAGMGQNPSDQPEAALVCSCQMYRRASGSYLTQLTEESLWGSGGGR
jgi:hypothetical protein